MTRYHIAASGKPALCKAQDEESCPLGGQHFRSKDEANFFTELHPEAVAEHTAAATRRGLNPPAPKLDPKEQLEQATKSHPTAAVRELDDAELEKFRGVLARYNKAKQGDDAEAFLDSLEAYGQLEQLDVTKLDYAGNTESAERRVLQEIERRQAVAAVVQQNLGSTLEAVEAEMQRLADSNPSTVDGLDPERLADKAAAVRHFRNSWGIAVAEVTSFDGIRNILTSFDIAQLSAPEVGSRASHAGWQEGLQLARKHVTDYLN